jgi:ethanolamine utilization protein EutQ (cupin superfamily)
MTPDNHAIGYTGRKQRIRHHKSGDLTATSKRAKAMEYTKQLEMRRRQIAIKRAEQVSRIHYYDLPRNYEEVRFNTQQKAIVAITSAIERAMSTRMVVGMHRMKYKQRRQ